MAFEKTSWYIVNIDLNGEKRPFFLNFCLVLQFKSMIFMFKYGNDFFFGNAFIEEIKLIHDQSSGPSDPDLDQIFNVFFPLSSMIFSLFFVV